MMCGTGGRLTKNCTCGQFCSA